ncbi:MAG: radical SAM protein [Candidatus Eisenbacteria bacterium]
MRVTEIYASLQGEGTRSGRPSVLVRFTGCRLRCRYCDTAYAFRGGEEMTPERVAETVRSFGIPLVLLTGGEPLEQPELPALIDLLLGAAFEVVVETGGHVSVEGVDPRVIKILDCKCPGSGHDGDMYWRNLELLRDEDEVKFVVTDREDYLWAKRVVENRLAGWKGAVLFSAAHGRTTPRDLGEWILEDRLPARLQIQLHRLLWPEKTRGV